MRTLRRTLAATILAALLGGLGGQAIAQDEEARSNFTPVTGQTLDFSLDDSESQGWHNIGNWYISGFTSRHTVEWSDPRLPAEVVGLLSGGGFDSDEGQPGQVVLGQLLLEGPDGYWNGPMRHYYDEDADGHGMAWLTGHGAYEALSALLTTTTDPECVECLTFTGAIFEGAMPTMPESLEPAVE